MGLAVLLYVEQDSPPRQFVQNLLRLFFGLVPERSGPFGIEVLDREKRDELGLLLGKEHFQNFKEKPGGRSALGESIDPCGKVLISFSDRVMSHE